MLNKRKAVPRQIRDAKAADPGVVKLYLRGRGGASWGYGTVALAAFLAVTFGFRPAIAAACHSDNDRVKVSGILGVRTGAMVDSAKPYRYAVLRLDAPLCYSSADFGNVTNAAVIAILPEDEGELHRPWKLAGRHVILTGSLSHRVAATQPPEDLLLFNPRLEKAAD